MKKRIISNRLFIFQTIETIDKRPETQSLGIFNLSPYISEFGFFLFFHYLSTQVL